MITTTRKGKSVVHWIGVPPSASVSQLRMPTLLSNIECFQISEAAAGIRRKGVINSVRATAWPRNFLSSKTARKSPRTTEKTTASEVIPIVANVAGRRSPFSKTAT